MAFYNIFISHAWRYSDHYNMVVNWINEEKIDNPNFFWRNYSVPQHDPLISPDDPVGKKKLQTMLKEQIRPATLIVVISGMYVAHSSWIDFEIDTSNEFSKYIIGLKPWGQERIPLKVSDNADIMVGWNKKPLLDAIKATYFL